MPTLNTQDLTGAALDWAAAHAGAWQHAHEQFPTMTLDATFKGYEVFRFEGGRVVCRLVPNNPFRQDYVIFQPSTDWAIAGPIIEREGMDILHDISGQWFAYAGRDENQERDFHHYGPTPLIAAMRAFIAAKLGPTVEIPEELAP